MGAELNRRKKWSDEEHGPILEALWYEQRIRSCRKISRMMGFSHVLIWRKMRIMGLENPDSGGKPKGKSNFGERNEQIYEEHREGVEVDRLADAYHLSRKHIMRIVKAFRDSGKVF